MTELGYDDRSIDFSTTNTVLFSTATAALVGGLEVPVVGTGAAVEVEFFAPQVKHTANLPVSTYLVVNGAVDSATGQYRNWDTAQKAGGSMSRRLVLTNGVSYTFQVGVSTASGIATVCGFVTGGPGSGGSGGPVSAGVMYLRVAA